MVSGGGECYEGKFSSSYFNFLLISRSSSCCIFLTARLSSLLIRAFDMDDVSLIFTLAIRQTPIIKSSYYLFLTATKQNQQASWLYHCTCHSSKPYMLVSPSCQKTLCYDLWLPFSSPPFQILSFDLII